MNGMIWHDRHGMNRLACVECHEWHPVHGTVRYEWHGMARHGMNGTVSNTAVITTTPACNNKVFGQAAWDAG
jgi:hypothetical protein